MGEMSEKLKTVAEYNTKNMVDTPESVEVSAAITTKAIIIQIRVDSDDCGKIIGKQGRTIEALKTICLNTKNTQFPSDSRRVLIEVLEDEDSSFSYK